MKLQKNNFRPFAKNFRPRKFELKKTIKFSLHPPNEKSYHVTDDVERIKLA